MQTFTAFIYYAVLGTAVVVAGIYLFWWLKSLYKVKQAGPAPLRAHRSVLWREPGAVEQLDFRAGPGGREGAPAPPFRFLKEHSSGSNPCLSVKDARGRVWRVKWGDEVQSETFAIRLVWAVGYFVESTYFIPTGRIEDVPALDRARDCIDDECNFKDARFELDEQGVKKMFDEHGWAWNDNPFVGTKELNGLKIMVMLLSNWDNKDVRDVARGSNMAIFEYKLPDGIREARYLIIDWGASLGKWGLVGFRGKWDCAAYEAQTPELIKGVADGLVTWGYIGQRTDDAVEGITVEDVRWLYRYLGRITDEQLREGLRASGATADEVERFTRAIRARINLLQQVAEETEAYRSLTA